AGPAPELQSGSSWLRMIKRLAIRFTREMSTATRILFVCTGNICRSPLAEAIFAHLVRAEGLEQRFVIDSAGLDGWHAGQGADPRTCRIGAKYGVPVPSIARQFEPADYARFDLILAMDNGHFRALRARAPQAHRDK